MENKQELRKSVANKLGLYEDIKAPKIKREIYEVTFVDGKIYARFSLSGLPTKPYKKNGDGIAEVRESISFTKIFNTIDDFSKYAKTFFECSTEDIIKNYQS